MKLTWLITLICWKLVDNSVLSGRIIQCKPPKVINAVISCSTDALPNGNYVNLTRCNIFCKDGYERSNGPSTIDCYRRKWLHGGDDHTPYTKPTECRLKVPVVSIRPMTFGRSARLLRFGFLPEVEHDGMCSNSHCQRRYSGITKSVCLKFKCCWNEEKRDCYKYLPGECQVHKTKRSRCVGTWKGISQQQCVSKKCCYNDETHGCYSSKLAIRGTQVPSTSPHQVTAKPFERCRIRNSAKVRCPGTWRGITKAACLRRNCCYDANNGFCYIGLNDKSQSPPPEVGQMSTKSTPIPVVTKVFSTESVTQTMLTAMMTKPTSTEMMAMTTSSEMTTKKAVMNSMDMCEAARDERTACPHSWFEIPRFFCLAFKCCFDDMTGECFSVKSEPAIEKPWSARNSVASTPIEISCPELDVDGNKRETGPYRNMPPKVQCTNENRYDSQCTQTCPSEYFMIGQSIIRCGENGEWSNALASCIHVTRKACDLEIDLSTGKVSYSNEISKTFVTIIEKPRPPIWSNFVSSDTRHCDYQSLLDIHYDKMKALSIRLKYDVPSRFNFHMTSKDNPKDKGKSIWATSYHLNGIPGLSGRRMIPSKSDVTFWTMKSSSDTIYRVGKTKETSLPLHFNNESTIKVGLNRGVFLSNAYDIGKMGSGACHFCLTYS